jgi:hypothetical protein
MADREDQQVSFIVNRKGGENMMDTNCYIYSKARPMPEKDRIYWICSGKKKYNCPATAVTRISSRTLISLGAASHTHGSKLIENRVRAVEKEKILLAATMPSVPPRTVFGE